MQAARKPYLVRRQSALMLKCSDTEPVLQTLREHLDPSAADGVSAHLNLLYHFTSTAWFGTDSVYLVPSEAAVLTNLVTRIREVFPEYPAFGAVPERAVPHVTIGKRAPLSELKAAEAEVLSKLPIRQVCTTVELWSGPPPGTGRWQRHRTYQLGT